MPNCNRTFSRHPDSSFTDKFSERKSRIVQCNYFSGGCQSNTGRYIFWLTIHVTISSAWCDAHTHISGYHGSEHHPPFTSYEGHVVGKYSVLLDTTPQDKSIRRAHKRGSSMGKTRSCAHTQRKPRVVRGCRCPSWSVKLCRTASALPDRSSCASAQYDTRVYAKVNSTDIEQKDAAEGKRDESTVAHGTDSYTTHILLS